MNDLILRIYHRLPSPARSIAASLRGFYLNSWRYGPETEGLIAEAAERESWSPDQWRAWREESVARLLHRTATRVPYYREQWAERRRRGDTAPFEELRNWPILDKEELRQNPRAFLADDCDARQMYSERTSGTTGKPIDLWWSRDAVRRWFALYELRNRHWHGVSRFQPWAILGGQQVVPAGARRPPFWVWNSPMHQLYLSANHISRHNLRAYLDALEQYRVTHLITYSSSASQLAREAIDASLIPAGIKVAITNAEPLFPWQRETIRLGLGCQARETYGMAEIVTAASECPAGGLHLWPEVGLTEVIDDGHDTPALEGEAGRLICTGLLNRDMPLIRYAVGDRGRMVAHEHKCGCGRRLPMITAIEGRTNDLLLARDGRRVYWLNPVFYGLPLREAQIIQDSIDELRVLIVTAPEFQPSSATRIIERLKSRMGDVNVRLEKVDSIPRGPNGKFQAVVCNLSK